jgi:hypothetical protein
MDDTVSRQSLIGAFGADALLSQAAGASAPATMPRSSTAA